MKLERHQLMSPFFCFLHQLMSHLRREVKALCSAHQAHFKGIRYLDKSRPPNMWVRPMANNRKGREEDWAVWGTVDNRYGLFGKKLFITVWFMI